MLSRTADHLFWMARYIERAENTARLMDVVLKELLLPQTDENAMRSQRSVLAISELSEIFAARYDAVTAENVLRFMVADPGNPSSILSSLRSARENARAVRGALTTESWETINHTWLEFNRQLDEGMLDIDPDSVFESVKLRSHLWRGVTLGTALKDEAFYFTQLGIFLERADNTARILDVRFADGAPGARVPASMQLGDFYYWTSLLSSVSGLEIYRQVYRDVLMPERVVELLILNPSMPRSLLASLDRVCENLARLSTATSRDCERYAGKLRAELLYGEIRPILARGLHEYLTEFLGRIAVLGNKISATFLLPLTA
ncbi:MAG: alpha-E domain-containing protein [Pigmentiphaga sp.]|uniref:alpha-E domain-containing protein n=1 Tax=Pigmentiphaga sp. TaxID=1977564 RepID=UPI0029A8DA91|nr:alpha-E domain-containing protein [Pigmentiphaga sp.]MDX3904575.1 alpha-E domain-containing protein [Pigmentiphaga sp.]